MSTHPTDTQDLSVMIESLRGQLNKCRGEAANNRGRKSRTGTQLAELESQLTALLDLLDLRTNCDVDCDAPPAATQNSPATPTADPAMSSTPVATAIVETLERSLAQWQAQIMLAYSQGAAHELAEQLRSTIHLNESLQQRELRLESQRQSLEQLSADVLQQRARTQRQRRTISHMLRAQKAEALRDIEHQRQAWVEQIQQQQLTESSQPSVVSSQQSEELARLQLDLMAAQDELTDAQTDLQAALDAQQSDQLASQGLRASLDDAQRDLMDARDELRNTRENLQETSQLLHELEQCQPAESMQQAELAQVAETRERLSELETRLVAASQEIQDLKDQNFDLASQLTKHQVASSGHTPHVSFDSSTLSWEERKKLIMRQLEEDSFDEEGGNEPERTARRLEIEHVVLATQAEIARRDAEIAELQAIIEQQSDTRQGVAIGAAAFAQAFESDEMIQQERQKLKEIQLQWQDKLRQAEIDVSLERAKLARERTQLEQELEETKREKAALTSDPAQSKKRKWLEHLGLRDECRGDS